MKATVKVTKEVELKTLIVHAEVRYWEDTEVNGVDDEIGGFIPCRVGDSWKPIIDIDSGIILNWNRGTTAKVHYKVCDECSWELLDDKANIVLSEEDGYVPDTLCPKEPGDGDYIIMDIDENGKINDWKFDIDDFKGDE